MNKYCAKYSKNHDMANKSKKEIGQMVISDLKKSTNEKIQFCSECPPRKTYSKEELE